MKKTLIFLSLFISSFSFAQGLPPCYGDYLRPCFGSISAPNGDSYVGQFKDGTRNGQGTYTYAIGGKYVGQWKDGKKNGQGTTTFADGNQYVGQYKDGEKNGQGTFTWTNAEKYVGQFRDDKRNEFGTLYNANGSIYQQGLWRDDAFVQAQAPPPVIAPVVPKPPVSVSNPQEIKRQKCIRLGLAPGSVDFQQCMN